MKKLRTITFYDYGIEDIICRRKFSTLRCNEPDYRVGETLILSRQIESFCGYITIIKKEEISFKDLTQSDAQIENWSSLEALKARLLYSYPHLTEDSTLIRYGFFYNEEFNKGLLRGNKTDLTPYLDQGVVIMTSSDYKAKRLHKILGEIAPLNKQVTHYRIQDEIEPRLLSSPEQRALIKCGHMSIYEKHITLATDDMATVEINNKVVNLNNLKSIFEQNIILKSEGRFIVRSGIAIAYKGYKQSTVVYRSFWYSHKERQSSYTGPMPLNSFLFLDKDKKIRLSELDPFDSRLITPLKDGILKCIKGEL